ncbi:MAG: hypothetical protein ACLRMJ_00240 [Alistipes finegoldii]
MEHLYVIGIDYGTDSVRALLADAESGEELPSPSAIIPLGPGLYCDTAKSQFRQHPLDYLEAGAGAAAGHCAVSCAGGDTRHRRG